ncbi:MFS transporter [Kineococcus gynurae]|uniref:MFS transporter n=1 Tax=Kineococcus gynurae TaxID=452979 RepID=A0ABV5LX56_9ACTN
MAAPTDAGAPDGAGTGGVPRGRGPLSPAHRATTLGVVGLVTIIAFESMAVATTMPVTAQALGGVRSYGLAFSSFLTASLFGTVAAGPWADRAGPRTPLGVGVALFAGGQLLCALTPTFSLLLLGRSLAGAGGGLVGVSIYVVVGARYPDALRPQIFGYLSAAWVLPAVIGPAVAGWVTAWAGWRWVFGGVVPLAAVAALVVLPRIGGRAEASGEREPPGTVRSRVLRGLLLALAAGAFQLGAEGVTRGGVPSVLATVLGAVVVVVLLPRLLPPGTLRWVRGLPSVIAVRGLFTAAFFATEAFVPLMLVSERGFAPAQAGLALVSGAFGWFCGTTYQARRPVDYPRHRLLVAGGVLMTLGIGALSVLTATGAPGWFVLLAWLAAGGGMGLGMSTTSLLTLRMAEPGTQGRASSALALSDNLGGVLGISVAGAVFSAGHVGAGADEPLFAGIWAGLGVVALAAAVLAPRVVPTRTGGVGAPTSATVAGP